MVIFPVMKRRTALQKIGLGLSAGMTLPAWLSSCGPEDPAPEISYDGVVAIIGAGAAGLYAADILQSRGLQVVIFEASGRLGGRVRSISQFENNPLSNTNPIELGAERVIGSDSLWSKMIKQLERPFFEFPTTTSDRFLIDGTFKTKAEIETDADFIAAMNFFNDFKNYAGSNVSVQQAVVTAGLPVRVQKILNSMIGNKYGTSNDRLSATALAEGFSLLTRNSSELRLSTNPMQDVLSSRFSKIGNTIQFDHVVKSVNYSGEKVTIEGEHKVSEGGTENFSREFAKVIITVPVSVLKDGDIAFSPALPAEKTAALSAMDMDPALRIVLEFKQNFWGIDSAFIYGGDQVPEYFNVGAGETSPQFAKMLSLTANGQRALDLASQGDAMIPAVLAELDTYFDGKATLNVRRDLEDNTKILSVHYNWTEQPFIRGGVAYVKPGGSNADRIALGAPVGEKLFFAGEATDGNGEFGTISGALLSAERAAQELVDTIIV